MPHETPRANCECLHATPPAMSTHLGNPQYRGVQRAIPVIEGKVVAAGKVLGTLAGTWEQADELCKRGYRLPMLMADGPSLARLARATVAQFKAEHPQG